MSRPATLFSWICQLAAAAILLQTLYFKFTGAEESRWIFSTLGVEPWGRIGSGVVELIAAALLLVPRTATLGALLASGVMGGAILSHLFLLGIEVKGDGGLLFTLAVVVLLASAVVLILRRTQLPLIGCKFARKEGNAEMRREDAESAEKQGTRGIGASGAFEVPGM